MSDVVLGSALVHKGTWRIAELAWLLGASSGLYLAGMVLNDVFDRAIDARERPHRPIPSGRVSFASAIGLGTALMAVGLLCAVAASAASISIAVLLAALVLGYDAFLKRTFVGPWALGGCRFFNVMLGASASAAVTTGPEVAVALLIGLYVVGISYFAQQEATGASVRQLLLGTTTINAALAGLAVTIVSGWGYGERLPAVGTLFFVAALLQVPALAALLDPVPRKIQAAVTQLLRGIILIDATMVYAQTGELTPAIATAALVIPAAALGRWIFIT
jgi:4-hydroxybenzoate polyprenyltransferase